jgi:hypothetical protein
MACFFLPFHLEIKQKKNFLDRKKNMRKIPS